MYCARLAGAPGFLACPSLARRSESLRSASAALASVATPLNRTAANTPPVRIPSPTRSPSFGAGSALGSSPSALPMTNCIFPSSEVNTGVVISIFFSSAFPPKMYPASAPKGLNDPSPPPPPPVIPPAASLFPSLTPLSPPVFVSATTTSG